ncbi:MAG: hypothetical protein WB988_01550 [Candidatus Nitrosopolaris sp.]|jgi:hypothetical protein
MQRERLRNELSHGLHCLTKLRIVVTVIVHYVFSLGPQFDIMIHSGKELDYAYGHESDANVRERKKESSKTCQN